MFIPLHLRSTRSSPYHVKSLGGQVGVVVQQELVEVLVVAPGHQQAVQAAMGLVHTVLCAETFIPVIYYASLRSLRKTLRAFIIKKK